MKKSAGLLFLFAALLSSCKLIAPEADEETLEEWLVNNIVVMRDTLATKVKQGSEIPECTTDKSKYENGKPVELVLTNTTGQPISYHPWGVYLLRKEGKKWTRYEFLMNNYVGCGNLYPQQLPADEKFTLRWDQFLNKQGENVLLREQAPKGKYRFCIPYWMGENMFGSVNRVTSVNWYSIYYPYNYYYFNPFETERRQRSQTTAIQKILISNEFEI